METPVTVGIVGCGDVAHRYARALHDGVRVGMRCEVVMDLDPARATDFSQTYGLPCVTSLDALLACGPELICICAPNVTHPRIAIRCLASKRHVLIEHPLAMTSEDAEAVVDAGRRAARAVFVMRQRRFSRPIQALKHALRRNVVYGVRGASLSVRWNRRPEYFENRPWRAAMESGGVVTNQASHFLDLLLYLFGDPVTARGVLGQLRQGISCEDAAFGVLGLANGVEVSIECTTAAPVGTNVTSLVIEADSGQIAIGGRDLDCFVVPPRGDVQPVEIAVEPITGDHKGYLQRVARRLRGYAVEVVDGNEGSRAVRAIEMIYRNFARHNERARAHFDEVMGACQS